MPDHSSPAAGADATHRPAVPLLGGDMADWSDRPACSPLVGSAVRRTLSAVAGPVLLLGPRAAALHAQVADPVVITRGLADARALAEAGVEVACGSLPHVPARAFAAVVCLDPPQRLLSPDDEGMSHLEVLARVRALAPVSIVGVEGGSPLPIAPQPHRLAGNDAWWVGQAGFDAVAPTSYDVRAVTEGASLLSALPSVGTARLLNPYGVPLSSRARAALADHPETLARVRGGLSDQLAGGWLVVTGASAANHLLTTPLASEGPDVEHDPDAPDNEVRLLEPDLRRALATDQLHRAGQILDAYLDWLTDLDPAVRPFALIRNTGYNSDGHFERIETGWRLRTGSIHRTDDTIVCAMAMIDFADSIVRQPGSHPFGAELSPDDVAGQLLRLTGRGDLFVGDARALHTRLGILPRPAWPVAPSDGREAELAAELATAHAQLRALRADLTKSQRRNRALEHALATEGGPRARRAFYLMTTPTTRIVEAARSRLRHKE